jgi:hypothetical protein
MRYGNGNGAVCFSSTMARLTCLDLEIQCLGWTCFSLRSYGLVMVTICLTLGIYLKVDLLPRDSSCLDSALTINMFCFSTGSWEPFDLVLHFKRMTLGMIHSVV